MKPKKIKTFFIGFATIITTSISIFGITKYRNLIYLPGVFKISDRFDWGKSECGPDNVKKLDNPIQNCLKTKIN